MNDQIYYFSITFVIACTFGACAMGSLLMSHDAYMQGRPVARAMCLGTAAVCTVLMVATFAMMAV